MKVITLKDYQNTSSDFKGKFSDFQGLHPELKGKRTILDYQNGSTVLLIEGKSLFIVKASDKVKTFGTDLTEILNTNCEVVKIEDKVSGDLDTVVSKTYVRGVLKNVVKDYKDFITDYGTFDHKEFGKHLVANKKVFIVTNKEGKYLIVG